MKQLFIIGLIIFICSCANTQSVLQEPLEGGGGLTASVYPESIFAKQPQDVDSLISFDAYKTYYTKYKNAWGFKSFAQSEGGAWAYVTKRESQDVADAEAVESCQSYNLKYAASYPCKLVVVSDQWLSSPHRAKEILATLPNYSPALPIDLRKISKLAAEDLHNEKYLDALAKHVWLYQHALEVDEHYYAVRLSFGLSDWARLGDKFPPAKTLLRYLAYTARIAVMDQPEGSFTQMHELLSINRELNRTDQTVTLFKWLDKNYPSISAKYFHMFQDALAEHKYYQLYNKYLKPKLDFSDMESAYLRDLELNKEGRYGNENQSKSMLDFATKKFIHDVCRLVAILVINDRKDETEYVVKRAKMALDTAEFDTALKNALAGESPKARY